MVDCKLQPLICLFVRPFVITRACVHYLPRNFVRDFARYRKKMKEKISALFSPYYQFIVKS